MEGMKMKWKAFKYFMFPVKNHPGEHQMSKFLFACVVAESAQLCCIEADVEKPVS